MERKEEWEVGGFQFRTKEDAELAKTELDKITFLEKRLRYDDPESILTIYNKAIENGICQTPVGFQYLQKLKGFLTERGLAGRARGIPLQQQYSSGVQEQGRGQEPDGRHVARVRVQPSQYRALRSKLRRSVLLNIVLILLVIIMFAITLTGKNANILNYERVLTDRYAGWEQELTQREAAVREKERALHMEE